MLFDIQVSITRLLSRLLSRTLSRYWASRNIHTAVWSEGGCVSNKGKEKVNIVVLEVRGLHQCMVCSIVSLLFCCCVPLTNIISEVWVCTLCIGLVHESDCNIYRYSLHAHAPMKLGSQSRLCFSLYIPHS